MRPICIACGCDEHHACPDKGGGCWWMRFDAAAKAGVCSACEDFVKQWDQGARVPILPLISERYHRQLLFLFTLEEAHAWMDLPQTLLGGRIPRQLILEGRLDAVRAIVDQLRSGVFV